MFLEVVSRHRKGEPRGERANLPCGMKREENGSVEFWEHVVEKGHKHAREVTAPLCIMMALTICSHRNVCE